METYGMFMTPWKFSAHCTKKCKYVLYKIVHIKEQTFDFTTVSLSMQKIILQQEILNDNGLF